MPVPSFGAARVAAVALSLVLCTAGQALARELSVCAEHNPSTRELTLVVSNQCVSSSFKYEGNNIEATVEQERASIQIKGGFRYTPPASGIGTTDCGGAKQVKIKVPGAEARRYSVVHNSTYLGLIDFTTKKGRVCATERAHSAFPTRSELNNWTSVDVTGWKPKTARSLMELIAPVYAGHPEAQEGRPTLNVEVAEAPDGSAMQINVRMTGYLDDSVSGEEFAALAGEGQEGWVLKGLWKRQLCARGRTAGQWTSEPCL